MPSNQAKTPKFTNPKVLVSYIYSFALHSKLICAFIQNSKFLCLCVSFKIQNSKFKIN